MVLGVPILKFFRLPIAPFFYRGLYSSNIVCFMETIQKFLPFSVLVRNFN